MKRFIKSSIKFIVIGLILAGALGFTIYHYYKQSGEVTDYLIANHIEQLAQAFHKIDEDAHIQEILHDRNYIDFLNVINFTGSAVGSLNVAYPQQWKGPYMQENPTLQGKLYEIVKTKSGYYIVPGQGVRLENGKIIGKDIVFDREADMTSLINENVGLLYKGKQLVAQLALKKYHLIPSGVAVSQTYEAEE